MPKNSPHRFTYTSHVLTRSQSIKPELLLDVLVVSSVKENWIILLINVHAAIFFGLFLLSSNYTIIDSLLFLATNVGATTLSSLILVFLVRTPEENLIEKRRQTAWWLMICDASISFGWGLSIMLLLQDTHPYQFNTLIAFLLAAGISTAALSAKLLRVLVIGRLLVFMPAMVFFLVQRPTDWLLHSSSITLCFTITLGIGYAIHVQLLREASLIVEMNEARTKTIQEAAFREYFLRSITHDLLQPLSSIKLFVRSLRKSSSEIGGRPEVTSIEMCLDSANEILDNVAQLVWVKDQLPKPNLTPIPIDNVLAPLVKIYQPRAAEKGLTLKYVTTSLSALSESSYLERAIRNLLENAIEHTQQGKILVGTRNRRSKNKIEIQVLDIGCGIEQKYWKKIFKEYERIDNSIDAEKGHLGLGLSIVHNIANSINGKATLVSHVDKGSCFGLLLPSHNNKQHIRSSKTFEKTPYQNKTAIIIDDDFEYAKFLRHLLLEIDIKSKIVSKPDEIELLRDAKLPQADYYIVDYHLKRLTGFDLLQNISNNGKRILISQLNDPEINAKASENDIFFIPKSDDALVMLSTLKSLIHKTKQQKKS